MKLDIYNRDWEDFEELPDKQKIKSKPKIKAIEDENPSKKNNYKKSPRKDEG